MSNRCTVATSLDMLTPQEAIWLEAYFANGFNALGAAREAGYGSKYGALKNAAYLNRKYLRPLIDERLNEMALPANEVLARLAAIARGSMEEFVDGRGKVSIQEGRRNQALHLVKSYSSGARGTSLELYSQLDALQLLAKAHGLLRERVDVSGNIGIHAQVDLTKLSQDELDELERLVDKASPTEPD